MIGLTTGRESNQRLNTLLKELALSIPNSHITRRGKSSKKELYSRLFYEGFTHAIVLYRWHGGPGRLDFFNVKPECMEQVPPSVLLKSVTLRREYATHEAPRITAITYGDVSTITRRLGKALSNILELPEAESTHDVRCSLHLRDNEEGTEIVIKSPVSVRELGPKLVISRLIWSLQG